MCVVGAINNYTAALKDSSSPCKRAASIDYYYCLNARNRNSYPSIHQLIRRRA
jgi:hypothetical protein